MWKGRREKDEQVALQMDRLWKPIFDKYDTDGDGKILLDDFKRFIDAEAGHGGDDVPDGVMHEIVERADWDRDRYITYPEFLHMIRVQQIMAQQPRLNRIINAAAVAVVPRRQRATVVRRYVDRYDCSPPPFFIIFITIIEIAMYIYYSVQLNEFSPTGPVPFESPFIYDPCQRDELWRFVTYMFIHAGFVHIFFNIIVQLMLGLPLEMVHKWWRVGLVYLAGVVAGSLGASISDAKSYLCGASGGVYALIAAHLSSVIINWSEMDFNWGRLVALILFGGSDIGVAVYERYWKGKRNRTSYSAHLTGALAGLLVGIVCLRNLRVRKWELYLGWACLIIYMLLMTAAIVYNVLDPRDHFPDAGEWLCADTDKYKDLP